MSWLDKLLGKEKGYKQLDEAAEFKEFDESAVALNAAIEAAQLTAQTSGKISDQIAYVELLLKKEPGNKVYIQNLKQLKAAAAAAAASAAARDGSEGSVEGSVEGSEEDSVGSAFSNEGGKKSRYSRKLKSKYSTKSKSK